MSRSNAESIWRKYFQHSNAACYKCTAFLPYVEGFWLFFFFIEKRYSSSYPKQQICIGCDGNRSFVLRDSCNQSILNLSPK